MSDSTSGTLETSSMTLLSTGTTTHSESKMPKLSWIELVRTTWPSRNLTISSWKRRAWTTLTQFSPLLRRKLTKLWIVRTSFKLLVIKTLRRSTGQRYSIFFLMDMLVPCFSLLCNNFWTRALTLKLSLSKLFLPEPLVRRTSSTRLPPSLASGTKLSSQPKATEVLKTDTSLARMSKRSSKSLRTIR